MGFELGLWVPKSTRPLENPSSRLSLFILNGNIPDVVDDAIDSVIPKQRMCVRGKVVCNENQELEKNVLVKLWDVDRCKFWK